MSNALIKCCDCKTPSSKLPKKREVADFFRIFADKAKTCDKEN